MIGKRFRRSKVVGGYKSSISKGRLTIPRDVRDQLSIRTGDTIAWTVVDDRLIGTPRNLDFAGIAGFLGDPPGGLAMLEEIDTAVRNAVGRHVVGNAQQHEREDSGVVST